MGTGIPMTTAIPTVTAMDNAPLNSGGLYRLLAWLSPSYPVGAFAYSHGIEWAVETGAVSDRDGLERWLRDLLVHGGACTS